MARATTEERRAELRAELAEIEMPAGGASLWGLYHRIRRRKGGNGFSHIPIEWQDLAAFMAVTGIRLTDWEVQAIEDIDDAFMAETARALAKPDG